MLFGVKKSSTLSPALNNDRSLNKNKTLNLNKFIKLSKLNRSLLECFAVNLALGSRCFERCVAFRS